MGKLAPLRSCRGAQNTEVLPTCLASEWEVASNHPSQTPLVPCRTPYAVATSGTDQASRRSCWASSWRLISSCWPLKYLSCQSQASQAAGAAIGRGRTPVLLSTKPDVGPNSWNDTNRVGPRPFFCCTGDTRSSGLPLVSAPFPCRGETCGPHRSRPGRISRKAGSRCTYPRSLRRPPPRHRPRDRAQGVMQSFTDKR